MTGLESVAFFPEPARLHEDRPGLLGLSATHVNDREEIVDPCEALPVAKVQRRLPREFQDLGPRRFEGRFVDRAVGKRDCGHVEGLNGQLEHPIQGA